MIKLPRLLKILTIDDFNNNEVLDISRYSSLRLRGISYDFYKKNIKNKFISQKFSGNIFIDYPYNIVWEDHYHGIHFTSNNLHCYDQYKKDSRIIYSASCHTEEDINLCNKKLFDFILISPVLCSHNIYSAIKWSRFSELSEHSYLPTYALGGLSSQANDYQKCIEHNGFYLVKLNQEKKVRLLRITMQSDNYFFPRISLGPQRATISFMLLNEDNKYKQIKDNVTFVLDLCYI